MSKILRQQYGRPDAIERAYELAREGNMPGKIAATLTREGYVDIAERFDSPMLTGDLRRIARSAKSQR